jgi:hypothetical protein
LARASNPLVDAGGQVLDGGRQVTAPAIAAAAIPAAIRCTRCGADATRAIELRPHEARYVEAHAADGEHFPFVCSAGHRLLLRTPRVPPTPPPEGRIRQVAALLGVDASKPSEVELARSIARAGLVR